MVLVKENKKSKAVNNKVLTFEKKKKSPIEYSDLFQNKKVVFFLWLICVLLIMFIINMMINIVIKTLVNSFINGNFKLFDVPNQFVKELTDIS
ncbi:TPA: type IV secretory system conjugative DNA transfer family protein, partial [Staphylococcus aureus]